MDNNSLSTSLELTLLKNRVAELEARESHWQTDYEQLKQLYDKSPLAYQSLDGDGCCIVVNQAWLDNLGYTHEEEVVGKKFTDFLNPNCHKQFWEKFPRFKVIGEIMGVEFEMVRKDGSALLVSFCGKVINDNQGNFKQTHCFFEDISDRRRLEEALEKRMIALTRPFTQMDGVTFEDLFDPVMIQRLQDEFSTAIGVASIITHPDGTFLTAPSNFTHLCSEIIRKTEQGCANCFKSDAFLGRLSLNGPRVQRCLSGGLWDAGVSITVGGIHIANWLIGQVRDETQDEESMRAYAEVIGADEATFMAAFRAVPIMPLKRFEQIAQALFTLANQLASAAYQNVQQSHFITERKNANASFRKAENNYREIYNSTHESIKIINAEDGTILDVNEPTLKMYGYDSKEEWLHRNISEFSANIPPYTEIEAHGHITKCINEGPQVFEWLAKKKSGETFWIEISLQKSEIGGKGTLLSVERNISERKQEEAYKEIALEVINILNGPEQLPDCIQCVLTTLKRQAKFDAVAIRLKDGEDFPYFAQQGFSEDFLLTENTLLELDADGKVCRDDSSKVKLECICGLVISGKTDPTNQLFTTGGSYWVNDLSEILNIQPSEDIRFHPRNQCLHHGYSSVALVPIRNKEKIIGLLQLNGRRKRCFTLNTVELLEGIALHIGVALMRRRAEEENAKLETQFQLAQKIESIGQLAGGVAHDFNNMLGVILGHSELAMNQIDPNQPYFFDLEKIHQAATRSADITRQLLTFARKQAISPKILNVNETVESLLSMLRRLIGANINLIWMPGNTLWPVKADPSQIDQILINLCVNARDAIGGIGKIIVETGNSSLDKKYCAAHPDVVPGEYVRIAVSDNGCGMDKETLLRIFEPFFTTKEIGKGTGLGLASVYGAVKQNKGFINVCSEPNFDTVFTIYLPRHLSSIEQVSVDRAMKPAARGHETILLVEDEPDILMMTTKILKSLGYFVLAVGAPGEAIQLVSQLAGEIHLLLTDVVMPEMNGRDLANKLLTFQPEVKCLFMSGYTADIISDQGVLAHGLNFIQKPFSVTDLAFKIREALEKE